MPWAVASVVRCRSLHNNKLGRIHRLHRLHTSSSLLLHGSPYMQHVEAIYVRHCSISSSPPGLLRPWKPSPTPPGADQGRPESQGSKPCLGYLTAVLDALHYCCVCVFGPREGELQLGAESITPVAACNPRRTQHVVAITVLSVACSTYLSTHTRLGTTTTR